MRYLATMVAFCVFSGAIAAGGTLPGPDHLNSAAEKVLAAVRENDDAALAELARREDPDRWLVADELAFRGEWKAAEALAKAGDPDDETELLAYLRSREDRPFDAKRRAALANAWKADANGDPKLALSLLDAAEVTADPASVHRLRLKSSVQYRLQRYEESAESFGQGADVARKLGWRSGTLLLLMLQSHSLYRSESLAEALEVARSRLEFARRWERTDEVVRSLNSLADIQRRLGRRDEAIAGLAESVKIAEAAELHAELGNGLLSLGNAYLESGRMDEAAAAYERSIRIFGKIGNRLGLAQAWNNLGIVRKKTGELAEALVCYRHSLELKEQLGNRRSAAVTRGNIGNIQMHLGSYREALASHTRALADLRAAGDRRGVARSLINLGNVWRRVGVYDKARRCLTVAEETARAIRSPSLECGAACSIGLVLYDAGRYAESIRAFERGLELAEGRGLLNDRATALNNLGLVYYALGDEARALTYFEQSIETKRKIGDRLGTANSIGNVGGILLRRGDPGAALKRYEEALRIFEELGAKASVARSIGNMAAACRDMGEPRRALKLSAKSLRILEKLEDRPGQVAALHGVGLALMDQNRLEDARRRLGEAVTLAEELERHHGLPAVLFDLAEVSLQTERYDDAIRFCRRAVDELNRASSGFGEERAASVRERWAEKIGIGFRAAIRKGNLPWAWFFAESGRAGAMLESLGSRNAIRAVTVSEDLRIEETAACAAVQAAVSALAAAQKTGERSAIGERTAELERARKAYADAVERIQREQKLAAHVVYGKVDSLEEIQARISPGEAMVTYVLLDAAAFALVLTDETARIVELGETAPILADAGALGATDRLAKPSEVGERVRKRLVTPLALGTKVRHVIVVPDSVLAYVPYRLLFPEREVSLIPSGTTYGLLLAERDREGRGVLALGSPDYGASAERKGLVAMRWGKRLTALPGSGEEARAVGDVVLTGRQASVSGLLATLGTRERWRAVHLACHGLADPERPMLSALVLSPEKNHDGALTALDVFRSRVPADLVVLSACESGRGKVYRAEGLVGLTRAFMLAGSPRVIASLWKVDDAATKALMVEFYRLWNPDAGRGLPPATALRKAQDYIRRQEAWRHPRHWAAWVLWGLPR